MAAKHLLHTPGREPMAGDVDDVVGATHDIDVALFVLEAGVGGLVIAGELVEVFCSKEPSCCHSVGRHAGANGNLTTMDPSVFAALPCSSRRPPVRRGRASPPSNRPRPTGLPVIAHPVSVCHQWSITGLFNNFSAQTRVSGSARSPARNSVRNFSRSYCAKNFPWGSSFLMERNAVGAVNIATHWCSTITRQDAGAPY